MIIYPSQYPTEHTAIDRTPYTYHICWSWLNKHYYGVRYGIGVHPSDLFNPYPTSSQYVAAFIKEHGEPDIIEVRKIFNDVESAREWEHRVLKKLKVGYNDNWLNESDARSIPDQTGSSKPNQSKAMSGRHHWYNGKETIMAFECPGPEWIRGRGPKFSKRNSEIHKGKLISKNQREITSKNTIGTAAYIDKNGKAFRCQNNDPRVISGELVSITKGKLWWTNGSINKRAFECPGEGWVRGRICSEEGKQKRRGKANYKDIEGNIIYCRTDDPRVLAGDLVGVNTNTGIFKDKNGIKLRCDKNDPRVLTGELISVHAYMSSLISSPNVHHLE